MTDPQFTDEWNDSLSGDFLWSNVNFGEAVSEVMTPLSWSVIALTLEEWTILPGYPPAGNIGGLPYLNLSIYASLLHPLGRSRQQMLETMEGLTFTRLPRDLEIPLIPLSRRTLLSILPNLLRFEWGQRRAVRQVPAYVAANPGWCERMRRQIREAEATAELLALWRDEIEPHVRQSVVKILGSASHSADHTAKLRRELAELVGPDDADALTANLSGEGHLLASLGPLVGLSKVARGELDRDAYLEQYGHRGPDEFELSAPRPAEDPDWLDEQLARLDASGTDPEAMLAGRRAAHRAAWDRFQTDHPRQARAVRRRIDEGAPRARLREEARSEYARDRWVVRALALQAGELTGLGDDVFFLSVAEMLALLGGDRRGVDHIPARRRTYEGYKALPAYPPIICGRFDPVQWAADPNRRSDLYDGRALAPAPEQPSTDFGPVTGSPGSAGQVEGIVRRLDHFQDGDQLQPGEILVTAQTNIGWTFLFPRAAAVVTDVGAPLSHAAIVARELGIPAVVGCGDATARLSTGDRVRVDGGRGIVEILDLA